MTCVWLTNQGLNIGAKLGAKRIYLPKKLTFRWDSPARILGQFLIRDGGGQGG